ncbi:MAG TPA: ABC transporter permease [Terriglobales bacterium]|jgi:predicted permease
MRDVHYGLRLLLRAPGFALVAILTLALGIGANTAIFSIVGPMLFEPLPFPQPGRLVEVAHTNHGEFQNGLTGTEAMYLLGHQHTLSAAAIVDSFAASNLSGAGRPVRVATARVTHGFFRVWGFAPARGRDFNAGDDAVGAPATAILSDGLWRSQFGADPDAVGRTIRMNDVLYTVIGVMPADFVSLTQNQLDPTPTQIWTDMQPTEAALAPLGPNLDFLGRLAPGASLAQANADLAASLAGFHQIHPQIAAHAGWGARSLHDAIAGDSRAPLLLLLGAVGLVLLIACANLANLLLARATGRTRELAIRAALGANPTRLIRQLLTESLLLAGLGAALGWLLALWTVPVLARLTPTAYVLPLTGGLNGTALLFTAGAAVLAGLLFGLAPALQAARGSLQASLKDSVGNAAGPAAGRARSALIVAEVALAFLLLAGAGLLAASLRQLNQVNPGFNLQGVWTVQTTLTGPRAATDDATTRFNQQVLDRLRRTPGITAAASITGVPLTRAMNYPVSIPGHTSDQDLFAVEWRAISPDFFRTLSIPVLRGRDFSLSDTASAPTVAIVNAAFAKRYWPGESGLGQVIHLTDPDGATHHTLSIVGIAGDVRVNGVDEAPPRTLYVPQAQASDAINALVNHWFGMGYIIRGDDPQLGSAVRAAFRSVDPNQPLYNLESLQQIKGASLGQYNFMGLLLAVFAALALTLAAIGIYGVLAYAVAQQRREIGIRMALGASRSAVLWRFLAYGLKRAGLGLVLGMVGAFWLMRLLGGFLYGVTPADPRVLGAVAAALLLLALAACLRPAWVATRVDPLHALRQD